MDTYKISFDEYHRLLRETGFMTEGNPASHGGEIILDFGNCQVMQSGNTIPFSGLTQAEYLQFIKPPNPREQMRESLYRLRNQLVLMQHRCDERKELTLYGDIEYLVQQAIEKIGTS